MHPQEIHFDAEKKIRSIEMYYTTKSDETTIMGISVSRRCRLTLHLIINTAHAQLFIALFDIIIFSLVLKVLLSRFAN